MYQEVTKPHCSHTLELQSENLTLLAFSFFLSFNFLLLHMLHFSPRSAVNFAENWFFSYYCFYCFVIVFLRYACFHCGFHFTRCLLSLRTSSVFIWHKRAIRNPNLQLSVRIHLLKQFTDVYVDIYIYIYLYVPLYLFACVAWRWGRYKLISCFCCRNDCWSSITFSKNSSNFADVFYTCLCCMYIYLYSLLVLIVKKHDGHITVFAHTYTLVSSAES